MANIVASGFRAPAMILGAPASNTKCITLYHYVPYRKVSNPAIFLAMTESRVALLIRVPANLKVRLSEIAKRERRSLSKQVELMLESCLEGQNQEGTTTSRGRVGHRAEG